MLAELAAWVRLPDSFTPSSSFSDVTVTVCAVFQLPLLPPVKISVPVLPEIRPRPLTVMTPCSAAGTVTVTVTLRPGSVSSLTV